MNLKLIFQIKYTVNTFFHLDTDNILFSLIKKSDHQNSTSQTKTASQPSTKPSAAQENLKMLT